MSKTQLQFLHAIRQKRRELNIRNVFTERDWWTCIPLAIYETYLLFKCGADVSNSGVTVTLILFAFNTLVIVLCMYYNYAGIVLLSLGFLMADRDVRIHGVSSDQWLFESILYPVSIGIIWWRLIRFKRMSKISKCNPTQERI